MARGGTKGEGKLRIKKGEAAQPLMFDVRGLMFDGRIADFGMRRAENGRRIVSRLLPQRSTATLAALPAMSLIPIAPFADLRMIVRLTGFLPHDVFVVSSVD